MPISLDDGLALRVKMGTLWAMIAPRGAIVRTPIIRTLVLQRFRSVPAARIELNNPTFLVGRNGSGKSNLADAFSFLSEAMTSSLDSVFERRGGPSVVLSRSPGPAEPSRLGLGAVLGQLDGGTSGGRYAFEVSLGPRHGFEVTREQCRVVRRDGERFWFEREKADFRSNIAGLRPALEPSALGLPVIGGDARFAPVLQALAAIQVHSIEPARLRQAQDSNGSLRLRRDGSNCAGVLRDIGERSPGDLSRITEILATIVPEIQQVGVKEHGGRLSLELVQGSDDGQRALRFEAANMSDGTLRALGLLAAIYQRPTPSLLIIEEPEATIHAGAIGAVLDLLRHAARTMQVMVTTHSPELLDAEWIEDQHLRVTEWGSGATTVAGVSEVTRRALRQHIMGAGELLRSNALEAGSPTGEPPAALFEGGPG